MPSTSPVLIRLAQRADTAALVTLAELDSAPALLGPVLVAELDGRIVAALGVESGRRIADPFVATADLLALLELRVRREAAVARRRPRGRGRGRRSLGALRRVRAA